MRIMDAGRIRSEIASDPRLSKSQLDAVRRLASADRDATLDGLDQKMRPVVTARVGGSRFRSRTALMRNGDPAKAQMPLAEKWDAVR